MTIENTTGAKKEKRKAEREVYSWSAFLNKNGSAVGNQVEGKDVVASLFIKGLPIEDAYKEWSQKKGVRLALEGDGDPDDPTWMPQVHRTRDWMKDKRPLQYETKTTKEDIEQFENV